MDVHPIMCNFHRWRGQRWKIITTCRREIGSTWVTVRQLFSSRKAIEEVLKFIGTTTIGIKSYKQVEKEEVNRGHAVLGFDDEQFEGDMKEVEEGKKKKYGVEEVEQDREEG